jgi:HPt (histidine-containing phosphotransfer) domain-containing protein
LISTCTPRLLLDAVNGDRDIFRSLAVILVRETHLRFDAVASAAAAGDARTMGFAAHGLKGTVSTVGAEDVVTLLRAIEQAGLREGRVGEETQLEALHLGLGAIRDEVAHFLKQL